VGPRAGLDTEGIGKILLPLPRIETQSTVVQYAVRHYTDSATLVPFKNGSLNFNGKFSSMPYNQSTYQCRYYQQIPVRNDIAMEGLPLNATLQSLKR
jgi:hypothetical protein